MNYEKTALIINVAKDDIAFSFNDDTINNILKLKSLNSYDFNVDVITLIDIVYDDISEYNTLDRYDFIIDFNIKYAKFNNIIVTKKLKYSDDIQKLVTTNLSDNTNLTKLIINEDVDVLIIGGNCTHDCAICNKPTNYNEVNNIYNKLKFREKHNLLTKTLYLSLFPTVISDDDTEELIVYAEEFTIKYGISLAPKIKYDAKLLPYVNVVILEDYTLLNEVDEIYYTQTDVENTINNIFNVNPDIKIIMEFGVIAHEQNWVSYADKLFKLGVNNIIVNLVVADKSLDILEEHKKIKTIIQKLYERNAKL